MECCFLKPRPFKGGEKRLRDFRLQMEELRLGTCQFPGCTAQAIGSHTISKIAYLKQLADDGLTVSGVDRELKDGFFEEEIANASRLPCFCGKAGPNNGHDRILFYEIDNFSLSENFDERVMFISLYRSLTAFLIQKKAEMAYVKSDYFRWHHGEKATTNLIGREGFLRGWETFLKELQVRIDLGREVIDRLEKQKRYMERFMAIHNGKLLIHTADRWIHKCVVSDKKPKFMTASMACFEDFFLNKNSYFFGLTTVRMKSGNWAKVFSFFPLNTEFSETTRKGVVMLSEMERDISVGLGGAVAKVMTSTIFRTSTNLWLNEAWKNSLVKTHPTTIANLMSQQLVAGQELEDYGRELYLCISKALNKGSPTSRKGWEDRTLDEATMMLKSSWIAKSVYTVSQLRITQGRVRPYQFSLKPKTL